MAEKPITPEAAILFLHGVETYFEGVAGESKEDMAVQANANNARTCKKIMQLIAKDHPDAL